MVILLVILIPVTSALTAYITLKAYSLGLKHNYELKHDIQPQEVKIPPIHKTVQDSGISWDEYLFGERK